jgi:hypothetical protein
MQKKGGKVNVGKEISYFTWKEVRRESLDRRWKRGRRRGRKRQKQGKTELREEEQPCLCFRGNSLLLIFSLRKK